jgi:hypothetical protein
MQHGNEPRKLLQTELAVKLWKGQQGNVQNHVKGSFEQLKLARFSRVNVFILRAHWFLFRPTHRIRGEAQGIDVGEVTIYCW